MNIATITAKHLTPRTTAFLDKQGQVICVVSFPDANDRKKYLHSVINQLQQYQRELSELEDVIDVLEGRVAN